MTEKELKERREKWAKLPAAEQRQKMGELVTAQRAILDTAETEKRGLSGEESATYDGMDADVEAIDANLTESAEATRRSEERARKLAEREGRLAEPQREPIRLEVEHRGGRARETAEIIPAAWRKRYTSDVLEKHEARAKPEYEKAFSAFLTALDARDELTPTERRDLSMGTGNQGGYAVPVQEFVQKLIMKLDDEVPLYALSTKNDLPQAASLGVPTLEANPADGDWTSELAVGSTDTAMAFGKRELTPWPIAKLLKMSRKLMRASPMGLDGVVLDRLPYKIAKPLDNALCNGDGNNKPLGAFTQSASGVPTAQDTTLITSSHIDPDKLMTLRHSIRDVYAALKSTRWVLHRTVLADIRKAKATTGVYLWSPAMGLTGPVPGVLLDLPYTMDENAPVFTATGGLRIIMLGALEYIWTATALNFEIQRLDELFAQTNQVGYIVRAEIDGMPVLGEAFVGGTAA